MTRKDVALTALIGVCLLPAVMLEMRIAASADALWLAGAADKILSGLRMTDAYYDLNPPMSYLIFLPAAAMARMGMSLDQAIGLYTMLLAAVAFTLNAVLLRLWPGIGAARYWGILASWCVGVLVLTQHEFGQKDHLISIMMLPFVLAQKAVTDRKDVSRFLLCLVFCLGAPFFLIKPHYGILPVMMLAHRAWAQKRLPVLDPDFIVLALATLAYAGVVAFFFTDFIDQVLPRAVLLYVSHVLSDSLYPVSMALAGLAVFLTLMAFFASGDRDSYGMAQFMNIMLVGAVIGFFTQFKGFAVHLPPVTGWLALASFTTVSLLAERRLREASGVVIAGMVAAIFAIGYLVMPPDNAMPTPQVYRESPLGRLLTDKAAGGSVFLQSSSTNIFVPAAYYTGTPLASRFPNVWFLPAMKLPCPGRDCQDRKNKARDDFAGKMAADFHRYRPVLVALIAKPQPGEDFLGVFGGQADFQQEWRHYRKAGQFQLDYRDYYKGNISRRPVLLYDVYTRLPDDSMVEPKNDNR